MEIQLVPQHGLVLGTLVASAVFQNLYLMMKVGEARKRFKVLYPTMYASGDSEDAKKFNCVQRAHQNALEFSSTFTSLLIAAGLRFPTAASVAGVVYLLGRLAYFKGYSTGEPKNRMRGRFMYLGLVSLLGMTSYFAVELLSGF